MPPSPHSSDPLDFVRNLWSNMGFSLPGMVTPTFDANELEKRIHDLKAVEGWLRMNLSMLQMTIQSLEMQLSTIGAVRAMGKFASASVQETAHASQAMAMPPAAEPATARNAEHRDEAEDKPKTAHAETPGVSPAFAQAAMWPWNLMQQMHAQMQEIQQQQQQAEQEKACRGQDASGAPAATPGQGEHKKKPAKAAKTNAPRGKGTAPKM